MALLPGVGCSPGPVSFPAAKALPAFCREDAKGAKTRNRRGRTGLEIGPGGTPARFSSPFRLFAPEGSRWPDTSRQENQIALGAFTDSGSAERTGQAAGGDEDGDAR